MFTEVYHCCTYDDGLDNEVEGENTFPTTVPNGFFRFCRLWAAAGMGLMGFYGFFGFFGLRAKWVSEMGFFGFCGYCEMGFFG